MGVVLEVVGIEAAAAAQLGPHYLRQSDYSAYSVGGINYWHRASLSGKHVSLQPIKPTH